MPRPPPAAARTPSTMTTPAQMGKPPPPPLSSFKDAPPCVLTAVRPSAGVWVGSPGAAVAAGVPLAAEPAGAAVLEAPGTGVPAPRVGAGVGVRVGGRGKRGDGGWCGVAKGDVEPLRALLPLDGLDREAVADLDADIGAGCPAAGRLLTSDDVGGVDGDAGVAFADELRLAPATEHVPDVGLHGEVRLHRAAGVGDGAEERHRRTEPLCGGGRRLSREQGAERGCGCHQDENAQGN